jgi:hypothetical protein
MKTTWRRAGFSTKATKTPHLVTQRKFNAFTAGPDTRSPICNSTHQNVNLKFRCVKTLKSLGFTGSKGAGTKISI